MKQEEIEKIILGRAYDSYFLGSETINLNTLCEELGLDGQLSWNTVQHMVHQGLLESYRKGGQYIIQLAGVLCAEAQNIGSEEIMHENRRIRPIILDKLAKIYEKSGRYADAMSEHLAEESGGDIKVWVKNLIVLRELGSVEYIDFDSWKITNEGLDSVIKERDRVGFAKEYQHISNLSPQPRGRALQKLLAKLFKINGWSQEEGARTSHEEMDVVIHKEREYFLVECKWEKDPIEAAIVRELHGKLSNRIGVQGMLVSMSGYTAGAIKQAEDYTSSRIILFLGKDDIEQMIFEQAPFNAMLNEKYQQLITRGKIICN